MTNLLVSLSTLYRLFFFFPLMWGGGKASPSNSEGVRDFSKVVHQPITGSLKGAVYFFGVEKSAYLELASNDLVPFPEQFGIPDGREAVLFQGVKLPLELRAHD